MATQAIIIDLSNDIDEDNDCFFTTPLSSRGFTKHDPISVENYDRYRHLHLYSHPIYIDLDDDDDLIIPKTLFEKGESSSSSSSSSFTCEICTEPKTTTESFQINGCTHFYCTTCISKYITTKLQNNILTITCPIPKCPGQIEPFQCHKIIPKQVFDRWGDALCEALMMSSSKRFYCPYKDCSALVFFDEENMKESECPHCNRMVCVECGVKWHGGIKCEEFRKLGEDEREGDDILLKKMAEDKKWRRCPFCKFYIEKSDGCLYMKCRYALVLVSYKILYKKT